jgi:hypothetical protein
MLENRFMPCPLLSHMNAKGRPNPRTPNTTDAQFGRDTKGPYRGKGASYGRVYSETRKKNGKFEANYYGNFLILSKKSIKIQRIAI